MCEETVSTTDTVTQEWMEACKAEVDRDRIIALRKQAAFEKALNIAQTVSATAFALVAALKEPVFPADITIPSVPKEYRSNLEQGR